MNISLHIHAMNLIMSDKPCRLHKHI